VKLVNVNCSARNMGQIALTKLRDQNFEDLAYFEPFYLKDFIAGTPKKVFK
jgi:tRNA threonylcarbamoyladenosine biosynthesis protein TsaB